MIKKVIVLLIFPVILSGCKSPAMLVEIPKFDTEGHRGCRGLMPENTIPAMLHAVDLNVTTLEMDVQITKDAQVVVSHDAWFNPDITAPFVSLASKPSAGSMLTMSSANNASFASSTWPSLHIATSLFAISAVVIF